MENNEIKGFENAKRDLDKANSFYNIYRNLLVNAIEKGLLSIIPGTGAIDSIIENGFSKSISKKQETLINSILSSSELITLDMIQNEKFIVDFARTVEVVRRLSNNDKIVFFGNLIRNGLLKPDSSKITDDDFDEYLSILQDLSYREIHYLKEFACFAQDKGGVVTGKQLKEFDRIMRKQYPHTSAISVINRLQRTGFVIQDFISHETDYGDEDLPAEVPVNLIFNEEPRRYMMDESYKDFYNMVLEKIPEA